jgi:hypothetical protein
MAQSPRYVFRDGYAKAKADAIDRCRIELSGSVGDEAIERCIAAIEALDVRHAMNSRLREIVTNGH